MKLPTTNCSCLKSFSIKILSKKYPQHHTLVCMVELEPGVLKPGESNLYLLNPYPGFYPALQTGQYTQQILTFKRQKRRLIGNSGCGCTIILNIKIIQGNFLKYTMSFLFLPTLCMI